MSDKEENKEEEKESEHELITRLREYELFKNIAEMLRALFCAAF